MKPTLVDAGLVALYFAISLVALRVGGFGWWWAIPFAIVIAGAAWGAGRLLVSG